MKSRIIILVVFLSFTLSAFAYESPVDSIRVKYQLPALGLTVIEGTKTGSAISGYRKYGDPALATIDDEFHLGSCTKAMTATLVAIYVQRGLLRWDTTLGEVFPENMNMDLAFKNLTIDHLTAHMSGITKDLMQYNHGKLWATISDPDLDPQAGRQLVAKEILSSPPDVKPGTKFFYNNINYIIVGAVLEKITHQSWEELMRENIFYPLGMNSCGFGAPGNPDAYPPDQPWPHSRSENGPEPLRPDFHADNPPTLGPAGTVHCSMPDWAKFLKMHIDGFNGKSSKILDAKGFIKLHTVYPGQDYTYGGWMLLYRDWAGGPVLTHSGSNTYNYADVWLAPLKNYGILSVTNIGDTKAAQGTDEIIAATINGL